MTLRPEVQIARRLLTRHALRPRVDVVGLARRYADVSIEKIPFQIDGLCLHLKRRDRRPLIIVNKDRPPLRQRFTIAHELGHVLIPWHVGQIVDGEDAEQSGLDWNHLQQEQEANRFASELLLPGAWVSSRIANSANPLATVQALGLEAETSEAAAARKAIELMPSGFIFVEIDTNGLVRSSGASPGTLRRAPTFGSTMDVEVFAGSAVEYWRPSGSGKMSLFHWFKFRLERKLPPIRDTRDWRNILEDIFMELRVSPTDAGRLTKSLPAIIAQASGSLGSEATIEAVYEHANIRMAMRADSDPIIASIIRHRRYADFLSQRVRSLKGGLGLPGSTRGKRKPASR